MGDALRSSDLIYSKCSTCRKNATNEISEISVALSHTRVLLAIKKWTDVRGCMREEHFPTKQLHHWYCLRSCSRNPSPDQTMWRNLSSSTTNNQSCWRAPESDSLLSSITLYGLPGPAPLLPIHDRMTMRQQLASPVASFISIRSLQRLSNSSTFDHSGNKLDVRFIVMSACTGACADWVPIAATALQTTTQVESSWSWPHHLWIFYRNGARSLHGLKKGLRASKEDMLSCLRRARGPVLIDWGPGGKTVGGEGAGLPLYCMVSSQPHVLH